MTAPRGPAELAIGVPVRNQLPFVQACLASVERHSPGVHLVLVDDASGSPCRRWLEEYAATRPHVVLLNNERQRGFPYSCNEIFYNAGAETVCLLNSDTLVSPEWDVRVLNAMAAAPAHALAGPSTCFTHTAQQLPGLLRARLDQNADTVAQIAAAVRHRFGDACRTLPTLGGFCLFARRALVKQIGYFDERFGLGCGEEDDFCYRAVKAGVRPIWVQGAYVHHFGHCSFTAELGAASARLWARNRALLELKVAASLGEMVHTPRPKEASRALVVEDDASR
jgi:GT2 family glycosyltransferase